MGIIANFGSFEKPLTLTNKSAEFSLNVFTEFSDKNIINLNRIFEPATFCVRDQDGITAPEKHR